MLHLLFPFTFTDTDDKYVRGIPLYQMDKQKLSKLSRNVRHLDASLCSSKSLFEGYNPDIPRLMLDLCESETSLFPRLLSLKTECRNDAEVLGVLPLFTPSLRSLELTIHHSATDYMHELLEGIQNNLQNLENLSISYCSAPAANSEELTDDHSVLRELDSYFYFPAIASSLPRSLKNLCVPSGCASIDTLFSISRLPLLESLTFTGKWGADTHEEEWSEFEASSFLVFSRLVVFDCSIQAAIGLLSVIPQSAPLSEVDIGLSELNSGLPELCTTLSRFHNSIRTISINQVGPDSSPTRLQEISEAFTSCSKLQRLTLNVQIEPSEEFQVLIDRLPHTCTVSIGERQI